MITIHIESADSTAKRRASISVKQMPAAVLSFVEQHETEENFELISGLIAAAVKGLEKMAGKPAVHKHSSAVSANGRL